MIELKEKYINICEFYMIEKSDEMRNENHSRFKEESGKGKTPSSLFFEFFWTFINKVNDSISN